jgi:hypothetical protein
MDMTTLNDPNGSRVIKVADTVWRRTPETTVATTVPEPRPCWSAEAETTYEQVMAFFARTWNTPSHIPLEFDPLDDPDLIAPGTSDGDAQIVDALRCLTIAIGEYVARLRQLNAEQGIGMVAVGPGGFSEQLGITVTDEPDKLWFGRQVVRMLDWMRGGDVVRHLEPHLHDLARAMLSDVLDFVYLGTAEIIRGTDLDDVFGEDFGSDVELVAVNENMPGLVWTRPPEA